MTELNSRFIAFFVITQLSFYSGCAPTPEQASMEQKFNDVSITTKVHEAIIDEPSLRPYDINVRTLKGVVELSGLVSSRDDMNKAVVIARSVKGVRFVKNEMRIPGTGDYW